MPTVDLYWRLSDLRTEEALDDRRKAKLRDEAARRGWTVHREVVENDAARVVDGAMRPASAFRRRTVRDRSGTIVRDPDTRKPVLRVIRPGWQSVVADLKTGRATAVLAEDLDRALRDPRDCEDLLDACEATGATAASLTGSLTLTNGGNDGEIFMARVMVAQAHKSSKDTGRRVRDSRDRLHGASYSGGPRPYGYCPEDGTEKYHRNLIVVDSEAAIIRECATRIIAGVSVRAVARDLNARGIESARGGKWSVQSLRRVLLKPTIAGLAGHNGHTVTATWKPILDRETWDALRAILTDPDRRTNQAGTEPRWLLSKIALCGYCGEETAMGKTSRETWPNQSVMVTGSYPSYTCSSGGHMRRNARHLDDYVSRLCIGWLDKHAAHALIPPPPVAPDRAAALRAEVKRLQAAQDDELALHREGLIPTAKLRASLREYKDRLGAIDAQLAHRGEEADPIPEFRAGLPAAQVWERLPLPRRRAIVRVLMVVTILPTTRRGPGFDPDAIRIEWKHDL